VADDAAAEAVFKALADPTRRQILENLAVGELSAGEVAAHFPISGPSVSRHLSVLRTAGLVSERKVANRVMYSVLAERLHDCLTAFLSIVCPDERDAVTAPAAKKQAKRRHKEHEKRKRKAPAPRATAAHPLRVAGGASHLAGQPAGPGPSEHAADVDSSGPSAPARTSRARAQPSPEHDPFVTPPHAYLQGPSTTA
jgi:DNA-binding transcriptional ArsR family regulator